MENNINDNNDKNEIQPRTMAKIYTHKYWKCVHDNKRGVHNRTENKSSSVLCFNQTKNIVF